MKLLVTGGYFDASGEGVLWLVDLERESAEVVLRWTPSEHLRVPAKGFAGGDRRGDTLFVAAHAAVVRVDLERFEVEDVIHQPCMNDLHHVRVHRERLLVANTGLGAVDVFSLDGGFLGSHALLPAWANAKRLGGQGMPDQWRAEGPDERYHTGEFGQPFHRRRVVDHLHVNHVAAVAGRLVATCFADGSLRDLTSFEVLARWPGRFLHDGVGDTGRFWLTAIDGTLLEVDAVSFAEHRRLHVFATGHYGWCRGLAVTPTQLAVGLTEVRPGRLPRHRWADRNPAGSETSVLLLDRVDGRLLARVDLSDPGRHSKLYSLIPVGDRDGAALH